MHSRIFIAFCPGGLNPYNSAVRFVGFVFCMARLDGCGHSTISIYLLAIAGALAPPHAMQNIIRDINEQHRKKRKTNGKRLYLFIRGELEQSSGR